MGTHESVKGELVEDGALGRKVKESGFKMRMVRGGTSCGCCMGKRHAHLMECAEETYDIILSPKCKNGCGKFLWSFIFIIYGVPDIGILDNFFQ